MPQARCPACSRLLEFSIGCDASPSQCPACGAQFVPGRQRPADEPPTPIDERFQRDLPATLPAMDRPFHSNSSNAVNTLVAPNSDWRLAKYTFVIACILRCLIAALTNNNLDAFLVDAVMAPVFALILTALAIFTKGVIFGWGQESTLPPMRPLLWLFVTGLSLGGLSGGVLAGAAKDSDPAKVVVAVLIAGFLGAFSFLLLGMWIIMIVGALRDLRRKIAKASRPERHSNTTPGSFP